MKKETKFKISVTAMILCFAIGAILLVFGMSALNNGINTNIDANFQAYVDGVSQGGLLMLIGMLFVFMGGPICFAMGVFNS